MSEHTQTNLPQLTNAANTLNQVIVDLSNTPPELVIRASKLANCFKAVSIEDDDDYEIATDDLSDIKGYLNQVESMRKEIKSPIVAAGKQIDAFFKTPLDFCKSAEIVLKEAVGAYLEKIESAATKAASQAETAKAIAIDEANERGDTATATMLENAIVPASSLAKPKNKAVSQRKAWEGEVIDLALLLVAILDPTNEYATSDLVMINKKALNQKAKAVNGKQVLPGVNFYEKKTLAAKATKK
ncbi:MAG: hypothetical protein RPR28_06425 [Cycloclasticus sp.]